MRAMVLPAPGAPFQMQERQVSEPGDGEIRVKVSACGVCRTDLHVVDAGPAALRAVRKGGKVVCAGIHMSDTPRFPYHLLWEERQLVSDANLTRQDGLDFLKIAPQAEIRTRTTAFPLAEANDVLTQLRTGQVLGAAVLIPEAGP